MNSRKADLIGDLSSQKRMDALTADCARSYRAWDVGLYLALLLSVAVVLVTVWWVS